MTTIAICDRYIAADGLCTAGERILATDFVKIRFRGGRFYAITGLESAFDAAIRWHEAGADPASLPICPGEPKESWWGLVVLSSTGLVRYASDLCWPELHSAPFAAGSGRDFALGAMWAGANAIEAVRLVADRTIHSGGKIVSYEYPGLLERKPSRSVRKPQIVVA